MFGIHSGTRGPAAGGEWRGFPKWGLEYLSPSFGYKGDQREGVGRNKTGRVGGGFGREERHPHRKEGQRSGGWEFLHLLNDLCRPIAGQ